MLEPGTRLAAYDVSERLAVGGMGEVYLCRHRLLDRIDAVKVLRPHLVADEEFRRRFLREALSAAKLRHPHIVTVYTADEVDGQLYLAMEYVPGADLAALVERDRGLEPRRVVALLGQIAGALDAAHRLGMTHRDVKPSNVLVERPDAADEHAYLVDFGLSKSRHAGDQDITQAGQVLGSVAYIAPEQLEGKDADGRCDQYSLACMAFECFTGSVPFPRDNQLAVLTAHLAMPPPAMSAVRPTLPPALDPVVAKAMAKAPDDRYPTCADFVAALAAALTAAAPPTSSPLPGTTTRAPSPPEPAIVPPGASTRPFTALVEVPGLVEAPGPPVTAEAPAPAAPPPPPVGPARLGLAVVGGPESGQVTPLPDGDHVAAPPCAPDQQPSQARFGLHISGWNVQVHDATDVRINGHPVTAPRSLHPGDVIEAGPSLFEVRQVDQLGRFPPGAVLHDPVTLDHIARRQLHAARRGPQHPHAMVVRVGWRTGRPPAPLWVSLGRPSAIALRGEPEAVAGPLRWILAQATVVHDPRDLCLAVAVTPTATDRWTWLSATPHARSGTPPLSGLHVTTNTAGTGDLLARLRTLIDMRRSVARGGPAYHASAVLPRVLAVVDSRLRSPSAEYVGTVGPQFGVHVLWLLGPTERPPAGCPVCLNVGAGGELALYTAGRPGGPVGFADGVPVTYARELADVLADTP